MNESEEDEAEEEEEKDEMEYGRADKGKRKIEKMTRNEGIEKAK